MLSKEQQEEIEKFKQKRAEANKKLKIVRRSLQVEIDSLQNRLKWGNILAVPGAVVVIGLVLAGVRKNKTRAQ